jgi:prolyl 4-hydroxylase
MVDIKDLEKRAKHDATAALALAEAHMLGIGCKADQKAAFRAVQQSARLGNEDARRAWVYLTNAGVGRKADPTVALAMLKELATEDRFAALQLAFLDHVTCDKRVAEVEPRVISSDPYIALFPGLFSPAECRYLMTLGNPWMAPGTILDSATGESVIDKMRDADAATIPMLAEDLVVQTINRCIAAATKTPPQYGEPLTVLRYAPGQQYRPHYDAVGADPRFRRQMTALIWLNEQFEGGETHFPLLKVTVRGGIGDMLVFRNLTDEGEADNRMKHAGLPVTQGVKWLASRWIGVNDYLQ